MLLTPPRAKFLSVQMSQKVPGLVAAKFSCKRCFLTIRSGLCPAGCVCPCLDSYSLHRGPACLVGSLASPRTAPLAWESGLGVSLRVRHRSQNSACSKPGKSQRSPCPLSFLPFIQEGRGAGPHREPYRVPAQPHRNLTEGNQGTYLAWLHRS